MKTVCAKCDSGKVQVEVMWRVTGREGDAPAQLDVAECKDCGHRWTLD